MTILHTEEPEQPTGEIWHQAKQKLTNLGTANIFYAVKAALCLKSKQLDRAHKHVRTPVLEIIVQSMGW